MGGAGIARIGWWVQIAGILASAVACTRESETPPSGPVSAESLRSRLALARSDVFHLVLDLGRGRLELRLRGALLREIPVLRVTRPARRVAFKTREEDLTWVLAVHDHGRLEPERPTDRYEVEVRPGDPDADPPPTRVPPPPEEAILAPSTFLLQFQDGMDLEVVSASVSREDDDAPGFLDGLFQALGLAPFHALRLRVVLDDTEAASLYRSLPPDIRLLIVPF